MTLKQNTMSAVRWTAASSFLRIFLQLAQLAILGRILGPEEYGLMAMVTVVLQVAMIFADLGLNSAYVQRQEVTPSERSSLYWLNLGMSAALCILVVVISPLLAMFFQDVRLTPLLMLASLVFVFNAVGQQLRMTQEKKLNFRPVATIEVVSALAGFGCAVISALLGVGVYALVWGVMTTSAMSALLAWVFLSKGWRPCFKFSWHEVKSYLGFGGAMVGNGIVNQINRDMDLILGGRMLAASSLGYFSIPRNLILQAQSAINPIITRVGFPLIAQVQNDTARVKSIYLKTMNMTASVNAVLYLFLAAYAPEIISILVGSQWLQSVDLLRVLAVWGFFRSTGNPAGSLLMGMGRADLSLKWNLALLFVVPTVLWIGSKYGTMGLAVSLTAFSMLALVPAWCVLIFPLCRAGLGEYLAAFMTPFCIAALSIFPVSFALSHMNFGLPRLIVGTAISLPIFLGLSYWLNRKWIVEIWNFISPVIFPGRVSRGN